jgi:hypothetical protein
MSRRPNALRASGTASFRSWSFRDLPVVIGAGAVVIAALAALVLVHAPSVALGLATVPLATTLFLTPKVWVSLTAIVLPFSPVLVFNAGGVSVPVVDLIAVLAFVSLMSTGASIATAARDARLIVFPAVVYLGACVIVTAPNADGIGAWATVLQRAELLLVWPLLGAILFRHSELERALNWFLMGCCVAAAAWYLAPVGGGAGLTGQKNPSGGFLASGILVALLGHLRPALRFSTVLWLAGALVLTGSRGSILGLVIGVGVAVVLLSDRKRVIVPAVAAIAGGLAALQFLPESAADRLLNRSDDARYNANLRNLFREDALIQWHEQPTGIGVGNYHHVLTPLQRVGTPDPHNAWVLALVEGGYLLFAVFLVFTLLTLLIGLAAARLSHLGKMALCVQVSLWAHVYVDVYWVRGTPALGLALLGASSAIVLAARSDASVRSSHGGDDVTSRPRFQM